MARRFVKAGGLRSLADDPLDFGIWYWVAQFLESSVADEVRASLKDRFLSTLQERHAHKAPFRIYGAAMGGRLSGDAEADCRVTQR